MRTFETLLAINNISVPVLLQEQNRFLKKLNVAKAAYCMVAKAMSARERQWDEYRKLLTGNVSFLNQQRLKPNRIFPLPIQMRQLMFLKQESKKFWTFPLSTCFMLTLTLRLTQNGYGKQLQKPLKTVTLLLFGVTILLVSMRFVTLTFRYLHISLLLSRPMAIALFGLLFDLAKKFVLKTGAW